MSKASPEQDPEVIGGQIESAFDSVVYPGDNELADSTNGEELVALAEDANSLVIGQALEHYWPPREAECNGGADAAI